MYTKKIVNLLTVSTSVLLLSACGTNFDTPINDDSTSFNKRENQATYYDESYDESNYSSNDTAESSSQISFEVTPNKERLSQKNKLGKLNVSSDRHMLQHADSTDFFWMADTAWEMSYKLNKNEVNTYLSNRREKGFTVIQMSAVDSHYFPENTEGNQPFKHNSIKHPNESYWSHIDYIINKAAENNLYIALLPAWNNLLQSTDEAKIYGKYIANRYKDKTNIIWVIGGDSGKGGSSWEKQKPIWQKLGHTIKTIVGESQLITYHPSGFASSSQWFNNESWLDFNMIQSGHCSEIDVANKFFRESYKESINKPILDGEPRYETIEKCFYKENRDGSKMTTRDVRTIAYEQVFSGAFGHTYGHQSIWQMFDFSKNYKPTAGSVSKSWKDALDDAGAFQMGYLAKLMKSRPMLGRVPNQALIASGNGMAVKGKGYALVYLPKGGNITIHLEKVSNQVKAWWYNPTTGDATEIGIFKGENHQFSSNGNDDMVLVLDDKSKGFNTPGL